MNLAHGWASTSRSKEPIKKKEGKEKRRKEITQDLEREKILSRSTSSDRAC